MKQDRDDKVRNAGDCIKLSLKEKRPYLVELCGARFLVHPQVFSPKYFKCSKLLNGRFPFFKRERFLEIGCGIGVTSILAALHHENRVVCGDINPHAVWCAVENSKMNGVSHLVEVRETNVFSAIAADETFDTVYWDLPFVYVPPDYQYKNVLERAFFDPGYRNTRTFLEQAPGYLRGNGRILVGFGSNGEFEVFRSITSELGYEIEELVRDHLAERGGLTYMILHLKKGARSTKDSLGV